MKPSARILVVDDDRSMLDLVSFMLKSSGFAAPAVAQSADEAFELLGLDDIDSSAGPAFELVLIDINMPGIDGIEASARIRLTRRYRDTPIIVFSADDSADVLQQVFLAGAHDFVAKPLRLAELIARIHAALRFKREVDRRRAREIQLRALLADKMVQSDAPHSALSDAPDIAEPVALPQDRVGAQAVARLVVDTGLALAIDGTTIGFLLDTLQSLSAFDQSPRRQAIAAMLAQDLVTLTEDVIAPTASQWTPT